MNNYEYVGVHLIDMPYSVPGITVQVDADTFVIFINSRLSHEQQCEAYDHEIGHIDRRDFDKMIGVDEIENVAHAMVG